MGTREFTDADERSRRREIVRSIGDAAFGRRLGRDSEDGTPKLAWHTDLANTIEAATGRSLGRSRVAQWLLTTDDAKPVPSWVMEALPAIARAAAADLRSRAAQLDALAAEDGAPPAPQGEPEADGEGPQESGPAAAEAADDDAPEIDLDAFMAAVCSEPPRPLDALPGPELHWQHTSLTGWVRRPVRGY